MLETLHVKNLVLIDEAEVEFTEGLNILTGETGAGKSVVLGSVNLALGGKYSPDMLRKGADYGLAELTFRIEQEEVRKKLEEMDIFPEEGRIIISRKLMEGRSTSRINGETVPLSKLREVSGLLIDIHGQHEHQSLLYKKNHLAILDAYAKDSRKARIETAEAYRAYRGLVKEWKAADLDESQRLKEMSFLEFEIQEIREASLSEEETRELEETYRKMNNGKRIAENVQEAHAYTGGGQGDAAEAVGRALRALQEITEYDGQAENLYGQLLEVDALLNDFNRELSGYAQSLSFSPELFYETENRLNEINRMKTKYGNSIEEILNYCAEKEERLQKLKDYDAYLTKLKVKLEEAEERLLKACEVLTQKRKKEAEKLQEQITAGLQDLNFLDVKFEIHFERADHPAENGYDDVEFLISMNPGEPVRPLGAVASGGELSRIMLAIKSVLAEKDEIETLIFDEIDVGISGRTAQKVSEKMAVAGRRHQVICITHLAQIAAMADTHFLIEKQVSGKKTNTGIKKLKGQESVEELARILGGAEITDKVLENAEEMKILAEKLKAKK